jgi:hypothetical protein
MLAYKMLQEEEQGLSPTDVEYENKHVLSCEWLEDLEDVQDACGCDGLQQQRIPKGNLFDEKSESVSQSR